MPCAYAHYKLGQQTLPAIPRDIRDQILPFKELFDIGLQGPDILFYHSPIVPDKVTKLGGAVHRLPGKTVFGYCYKVCQAHADSQGYPMYLAYACGCLCHFALDSMCHGYVNRFARDRGVSHNEIEMEFDRMLLTADGLDPLRHDTGGYIVATRRNASVIAAFYKGAELRQVMTSLKSMPVCLRTLLARDMRTRKALLALFRAAGKYKEMSGQIMSLEPNPICAESSRRLLELYKLAVPLAIKLISEFDRTFRGKIEPDKHYELNFLSERV